MALNRLGVSVVQVNPDLRAAELGYMIGHAEPASAVSIADRASDLSDAANFDLPVFGPNDEPLPPATTNAAPGRRRCSTLQVPRATPRAAC